MNACSLTRWLAVGIMAPAAFLLSGCESIKSAVVTTAEVVEENIELVGEKDRVRVLSGLKAVKSLVKEIDTPEEIALGQSLAVRAFASFGRPYPDAALRRYVTKVGRIVAFQSERPTLPYSFAVVQNEKPNALALPGGFVFVSTGLLKSLRSESELACILGHEICHVAQKHGLETTMRDRRVAHLMEFAATLEEDVQKYREFLDFAFDKLTREGYDRRYEWKADVAGAGYAWKAGYHPEGLLPFLKASRESGGALAFEVFKTHPDPGVRIRKIRSYLQKMRGELGDYSYLPQLQNRYRTEVLDRLK